MICKWSLRKLRQNEKDNTMSGKKAKALRKQVYGNEFSFRVREYMKNTKTGTIFCIGKRKEYQSLKRRYRVEN